MDDMISRQAAIDALAEGMPLSYTPDGSHPADEGIFMVQEIYADCIQTLEELPSAQPKIIRCDECRYYIRKSHRCEPLGLITCDGFWCKQAERKNNG